MCPFLLDTQRRNFRPAVVNQCEPYCVHLQLTYSSQQHQERREKEKSVDSAASAVHDDVFLKTDRVVKCGEP
ncbi:hypothetical protein I7I48_01057 [Histoplasma ohiense]|nr:hypothetical protein I7I48_01057 [Histoplasma ohiense (nom. inval.)]